MCYCQDLGYKYCARTNTARMLPHTLPLQWQDTVDPTLPQYRPDDEDHFLLCDKDCDGYHRYHRLVPPPRTSQSKYSELCKVFDGLYQSNICTAQAVVAAKEPCNVNFTHILSIHSGAARHIEALTPRAESTIISKQIFIPDTPRYNLVEHFPEICAFIHSATKKEGNNILVHCRAGVSRSASTVTAYSMWSRRLTYSTAKFLLRQARDIVYTGRFSKQLTLWENMDYRLTCELGAARIEYMTAVKENIWVRDSITVAPNLAALVDTTRPEKEHRNSFKFSQ